MTTNDSFQDEADHVVSRLVRMIALRPEFQGDLWDLASRMAAIADEVMLASSDDGRAQART